MQPIRFRLFSRIRHFLARLFGLSPFGGPDHSADPRAGVRAPRRGSPSGRSSAIALMEPDETRENAHAVGKWHRR